MLLVRMEAVGVRRRRISGGAQVSACHSAVAETRPSAGWYAEGARRPIRAIRPTANRTGRADSSSSRSEEHTSELQSRFDLVCRLLLEKKNSANSFIHSECSLEERHIID